MRPLKVAIQGIAASYHHEASKLYFKDDFEIVECGTFRNVCEKLATNDIDYAVMAIENSIAGSILPNYNLIRDNGFYIIGELYLRIGFHLLANDNVKLEDIKLVESHPMAIAQCTEFLAKHPNITVVTGSDTASVAKKIVEGKYTDRAAIAGAGAAGHYNLEIVKSNIEDNPENYTRFLIIAKHCPYDEKADKSTITFELPDSTGQLSTVLNIITEYKVNLSKIQSVPVPGKHNKYAFYLDLEWETKDQHDYLLSEIEKMTRKFALLGLYKSDKISVPETLKPQPERRRAILEKV